MPSPLPPDHPAFGPCIAVRRKGAGSWFAVVLLSFLSLLLILGGLALAIFKDLGSGLIACTLGLIVLGMAWVLLSHLLRVAEFYHEGAVLRILSRRQEFPYQSATSLTYSLTRNYYNGVYIGTGLDLDFETADNRRFEFTGTHKERPVGASIIGLFGRDFRGEDELDVIRDIISSCVALTLMPRVLAGEAVPWVLNTTISTAGVTPVCIGPRDGVLIPWAAIDRVSFQNGKLNLFETGQLKPFVTLPANSRNFYPGLELFQTLRAPHHASPLPTSLPAHDHPPLA